MELERRFWSIELALGHDLVDSDSFAFVLTSSPSLPSDSLHIISREAGHYTVALLVLVRHCASGQICGSSSARVFSGITHTALGLKRTPKQSVMMKPSSVVLVSSRWSLLLLLVVAWLALSARADCGADCARCSGRLGLQQTHISSIACVLQCEGRLNVGNSWGLCQGLLQATESTPEAEQVTEENEPQQQHQEEKKYGGFMKRYGGFMKRYGGFMKRYGGFMKKAAELYGLEPDDIDHGREILSSSDVEVLANQVEDDSRKEEAAIRDFLNARGGAAGLEGMAKRYGGFMRRGYDPEAQRLLQKRYGGFMRRVGRPEWAEESKRYGGFLKRSPQEDEEEEEEEEEESSEMEKRYGGFMRF
ncbi:hypothetical protein SRHO_G00022720 [Serrasalmus rhombeus]